MKKFQVQNNKARPNRYAYRCGRGFTLVETLVAISIFTLSILGLMSILSQGISNTSYAKKKITAAYLAQEGIEYVRNARDTFVIYDPAGPQTGWNDFRAWMASCVWARGCYFNADNMNWSDTTQPITDIPLQPCPVSSCPRLLYNSSNSRYGYTGTDSGFVRKIQFTAISTNEVKVTSTVTWTQGSGSYNAVFSENLLKWME